MAQLNGRVFTRLQQYDALPTELKREVEALEKHLTASQGDIFGSHRTLQLKSVYGVRTRPLLEKIEAWVKQHDDEFKPKEPKAEESERMPSPTHPPASNVANDLVSGISTPTTAPVKPVTKPAYSDPKVGAHIPRAKELLDALVLKGFVTPHKEDKPEDAQSAVEDLEFKDNELLVARGKDVAAAKNAGPTVWDLADGAVFAGMVKRKTGLLESIVYGKDTYAVVNMRLKNLTLFSSDLALEPLAQFDATKLRVSLDKSEFEHGVKVWTDSESELLDVASQIESDALVQALLAVGASHRDNLGHGHKAATAAEQLRNEVKNIVDGENHEVHVSDPSASKKKNEKAFADYPATHEADTQHKGWDIQKTPEVHATQPSNHSHNSVITDGLHTASHGNDTIGQTNAATTGTQHDTQPFGQSNTNVGNTNYPSASRGNDAIGQLNTATPNMKHESQPFGQSNANVGNTNYPSASRGNDALTQMSGATTGTMHETDPFGQSNNSVGGSNYPSFMRGNDAINEMSGATTGTQHETQPFGQSNNNVERGNYPGFMRGNDAIGETNASTTGTKHETQPRGFSQVADPTLMP